MAASFHLISVSNQGLIKVNFLHPRLAQFSNQLQV